MASTNDAFAVAITAWPAGPPMRAPMRSAAPTELFAAASTWAGSDASDVAIDAE